MPRNQGTSRKGKPGKRERASGMGQALKKAQGQRYRPKPNGRGGSGGGMALQPGVESIGMQQQQYDDRTKSVLEVSDLSDFLMQAEMANREFVSEKEGLVVLDDTGQLYRGPPTVQWADDANDDDDNERRRTRRADFAFTELSVPRRPAWDETTTPEELQRNENEAFLEWRRAIAHKEEEMARTQPQTAVTPFEKNLEVWRQLWRVLERSSCLLQLVDARNPLFYLSNDLRDYATSLGKPMMVLVNKSDYLSTAQRAQWRDYLIAKGWDPVFFSAALEQEKLDRIAQQQRRDETRARGPISLSHEEDPEGQDNNNTTGSVSCDGRGVDVPLNRQQLMETMLRFARQQNCQPDARFDSRIQFGMVGFPNVGKSSVINVLVGSSKHTHGLVRVGVAAQPGKTKHFQTLLLPDADDMMLCDCPGLVFPSFVSDTADLLAAGVFPIAQMRDHWPVIQLICQRIPREILNATYGIQLPVLSEQQLRERGLLLLSSGSDKNATAPPPLQPPPTADEFLTTLCVARGMLAASSGVPDYTRAARMVIKDYAAGKLLYCHAPPADDNGDDNSQQDTALFHQETIGTAMKQTQKLRVKLEKQQQQQQQQQGDAIAKVSEQEPDDDDDDESSSSLDGGENEEEAAAAAEAEVDNDLLELLGGGETTKTPSSASGSQTGPSRRSKRKGGRKKKNRSDDPYGCHCDPDELMLLGGNDGNGGGGVKGVTMMGGKYGKKGYTRPTGHGFVSTSSATNSSIK